MTAERKSALLIVDAQVGVLASVAEAGAIVRTIEALVRRARASEVPVIWVQHADHELQYGSDTWKLAPGLAPAPAEPIVHKQFNSSFAATELERHLRDLGVSRILLAGAATSWCIRATAYAALDRGYSLGIVSDAHSTEPVPLTDGSTVPAASIIAEFNTVMRWISYPNVTVDVDTAAQIAL